MRQWLYSIPRRKWIKPVKDEDNTNAPTGLNFAWSFPTPFTACNSMFTDWPGLSFARTMFGLVGAGGLAANMSTCSPTGSHMICEDNSSWLMYSSSGLIEPFGALGFRSHVTSILKTAVSRSVAVSLISRIGVINGNENGSNSKMNSPDFIVKSEGSMLRGTKPIRCARISSTITDVLSHT